MVDFLLIKLIATSPGWRKTWKSVCQTSSSSPSRHQSDSDMLPATASWGLWQRDHVSTGSLSICIKSFLETYFYFLRLMHLMWEHWFATWSFLKISRGTMKLSKARSNIRDRSSSIALKRPINLTVGNETWSECYIYNISLTISVSPSPLGFRQWPVHRQSV